MSLKRLIIATALGAAVGAVGVHAQRPDNSAQLLAADAMIAVAQKEAAAAKAEAAMANEIAAANFAALEAVKADLDRQAAIAAKAQAAERKRAADLKTALKRIHNAPKSEDGPIAPVLRRELDDLRTDSVRPDGPSDAPANPANETPIGADDGSG